MRESGGGGFDEADGKRERLCTVAQPDLTAAEAIMGHKLSIGVFTSLIIYGKRLFNAEWITLPCVSDRKNSGISSCLETKLYIDISVKGGKILVQYTNIYN